MLSNLLSCSLTLISSAVCLELVSPEVAAVSVIMVAGISLVLALLCAAWLRIAVSYAMAISL